MDDGAANHLIGMQLPSLEMQSTSAQVVNLSRCKGWVVIYCYPMTGVPGVPLPPNWDQIPGARGCTPQTNAYKDVHSQFRSLGVDVYGLSTQNTPYQQELAERLQLPFAILSDHALDFQQALQLPTFESDQKTLLKRLTLIVHCGVIQAVLYPVFPSHADAHRALAYLKLQIQ
jgi:peroxiredoxin